MEIALKIVRDERTYAYRNPERARRYDDVVSASQLTPDSEQGEFSERLLTLVEGMIKRGQDMKSIAGVEAVTQLVYGRDMRVLDVALGEYLRSKDGVWLLFDNLDK